MSEMTQAGTIPAWTLGWRMQRALVHAGISVETIAVELGVSRSTVSRWLNDRGAPPRAIYVKMLALHTGVPYGWITGDPEFRPGDNMSALIRMVAASNSQCTLAA